MTQQFYCCADTYGFLLSSGCFYLRKRRLLIIRDICKAWVRFNKKKSIFRLARDFRLKRLLAQLIFYQQINTTFVSTIEINASSSHHSRKEIPIVMPHLRFIQNSTVLSYDGGSLCLRHEIGHATMQFLQHSRRSSTSTEQWPLGMHCLQQNVHISTRS
jgi:hypothetical protein